VTAPDDLNQKGNSSYCRQLCCHILARSTDLWISWSDISVLARFVPDRNRCHRKRNVFHPRRRGHLHVYGWSVTGKNWYEIDPFHWRSHLRVAFTHCLARHEHVLDILYLLAFLTGTGSCFVYITRLSVVQRWFVQRRGLAADIVNLSCGVSAAIMAPVLASLLKTWGYVQMNT